LKTREKELREAVTNLQITLNDEQKAFQHTTNEQKHAILQLKEELLSVKSSTTQDAKFRKKESLASVSAIWREYKLKEHGLEQKLKSLEEKLHIETIVNNETKEFLMRKHGQLSDTISTWESKYDHEIGELDSNITILVTKRNQLLDKLSALQARRAKDLKEEAAKQLQWGQDQQRKQFERELLKRHNKCARGIQQAIRAYIKRKKELEMIKNAAKKAKAGKGKGKGKDGKKK
jgi:hypothetical protein